jgi:hypothetical protein
MKGATYGLRGSPVGVAIARDGLPARRIVISVQRDDSVLLRLNQFPVNFSARLTTHSRRLGASEAPPYAVEFDCASAFPPRSLAEATCFGVGSTVRSFVKVPRQLMVNESGAFVDPGRLKCLERKGCTAANAFVSIPLPYRPPDACLPNWRIG